MSPGPSSDTVLCLQVNGVCMEGKQHADVVAAIKAGGDETRLLVVDVLTDEFFKKCKVVPSEEHLAGGLGAVLWRGFFVSPLLVPCHFVPELGGAGESLRGGGGLVTPGTSRVTWFWRVVHSSIPLCCRAGCEGWVTKLGTWAVLGEHWPHAALAGHCCPPQ